ncbi:S9 family peptidase [Aporhodopirellula aestuarii]|uniref:S9 family peptidase n=1 Tax=Aporhodopirellula aestuarii TaxID=2950107 RepID=A0ABT0TZY3_9BACT|nr:DPP IV N-terminal domain-containing protein [Aporhodopirellula aestuarii]MCM2369788.1 S9 family peptidase [Aporhodopirellula aestuarii]
MHWSIAVSVRLLTAFTLAFGVGGLHPQSSADSSWYEETQSRFKDIYERGVFKPRPFEARWLPDSSGYIVEERDPNSAKKIDVTYDVETGEKTETTAEEKRSLRGSEYSPDGKRVIEYRDRKLFVRDLETGERTKLSPNAGERDVRYNDAEWSPDGSRIVFVESDSTEVRQRPMLSTDDPSYPSVQNRRFARVGEKITELRVGVVNSDGTNLQWLPIESPPEGFYLGQVEWAGNSEEILVEKMSRFRDVHEFLLAKTDGEIKQIYYEKDDAWAVGSQAKNVGLTWVRGGEAFIVISEKDGWRHAFLVSRDGTELAVLTPGEYDVIDRGAVDEEGGWYYFYASPENGTQKYLYRVPLDGSGTKERISPADQPGTHDYDFSPNAKWAFHTYSTVNTPPIVELVELAGHRVVRVVEDNSEVRKYAKELGCNPTEFVQLDIGDGIVMDASVTKPSDFDESKNYPVFIYVYGEPYLQTVLDSWGAAQVDFHRVIADLGYLVVSIDNRGTPAPKGAAWRRASFGSLGPLSTEEQEAGLQELGRMFPYVDLSRVGIWGWSGGGSNTLNAMFRKPDSYHVGIAVVPKPQPHLYNAWFQEIYMRTREVNPDGYERAAAINYAEGLKGKLLIVTGSGETNTHIQIIEGLVDRLIEMGKPFDYMVYPNRDHGLREGVGTVVHVRMLIARYLLANLPPGPM